MKLFNSHVASQCNPVNNLSVPPLLEYKTNGRLVSVNIKHDIYPILGNRILKKLMNGTTDQLGWFNVAEKLLWNLYNFMSFLEEGVYPDYWKKSNVVPIHKKESKNLIENYRPICILPVFSKVFERINFELLVQLLPWKQVKLNANQVFYLVIPRSQNSFPLHMIYINFCNSWVDVRGTFIDISKDFDKVWHDGLIHKLKSCGVENKLLNLIQNYLTNH